MTENSIRENIRLFIEHKFPLAHKRKLNDQDGLLEKGILDSMGILEVVQFMEAEFRISIGDEDLVPEHFQNLCRMAAFVQSKRATI